MVTPVSVLFLCTGNSCRSIMAEALFSHYGGQRFRSYSAGSFPTGEVHPVSLATLQAKGIGVAGYRSKPWDEFTHQPMDIVITVCDAAAGESCPAFPGEPLKAHWGVSDPAKFQGSEEETQAEFTRICNQLETRVQALVDLPVEEMDREALRQALQEIGRL
ncbi:Protein-tyrosine phosphatase, low molecular weight [Nitrosococcus halophilus Nc 4]|uniref:Protein-tyrosine phosphatase, low molecular weight n=1 Tax=Nitrosococcus halophilus (strain Nc4) TaxID=472759 RepID=D5C0S4_NITHN|nr:arsenate reductase ArsC [Nitrosococcus halophilus]ADE16397.1 Protein-tyrosine phosphatase, low molecular weight [Nitrosococcus halophilus Nc 4]